MNSLGCMAAREPKNVLVLYLPDALSIWMRQASLVIPENGMTGFVTHAKKLTLWQSCYISLAWINEWLPLKSQKPCPPWSCNNLGDVFPIFDSLCDRIWLLYGNDTQRGRCLHILPSFNSFCLNPFPITFHSEKKI